MRWVQLERQIVRVRCSGRRANKDRCFCATEWNGVEIKCPCEYEAESCECRETGCDDEERVTGEIVGGVRLVSVVKLVRVSIYRASVGCEITYLRKS